MKNDTLTEACVVAQEQWIATLPEQEENHIFSRQFDRRMNQLYNKMRGDHYHYLSRASLSVLVAASLIAALMITSVAYGPARRFLIKVFDDHTEFQTENTGLASIPMDIQFGYLPPGFKLTEREIDGETCALDEQGKMGFGSDYHFEDEDGRWIDVSKHPAGGWMGVDSEDHPIEILQYNNIDYYISHSDEDFYGVYWMIGGVQYDIGGNISRESIVKMAYQIR